MLNYEYPPLGGGQGNANYYLLKELQNYPKLKIDLITSSVGKYREQKLKTGKIYFLDIGKNNKNLNFQSKKELIVYSLKSMKLAEELIKQDKYDLIVAWSGIPSGYVAFKLKKKFGVSYIVLLRGADVPYWDSRFLLLDKFIFSWLSPKIWKCARKVIANSEMLKAKANVIAPKQKISIVPNGVDINLFCPSEKDKPNRDVRIISVGRLNKIKGYDFLIESLSGLNNIELTLIGDGPEKQNLITLAKKMNVRLILRGQMVQNEIIQELQRADIFALTSINEGMSNSLLEAMACGLPVICTNVGGSKELISKNGFVCKVGDKGELRCKMKRLIKDKNLRNRMREESRKIAEKMGWKGVAEKFVKAIEK